MIKSTLFQTTYLEVILPEYIIFHTNLFEHQEVVSQSKREAYRLLYKRMTFKLSSKYVKANVGNPLQSHSNTQLCRC